MDKYTRILRSLSSSQFSCSGHVLQLDDVFLRCVRKMEDTGTCSNTSMKQQISDTDSLSETSSIVPIAEEIKISKTKILRDDAMIRDSESETDVDMEGAENSPKLLKRDKKPRKKRRRACRTLTSTQKIDSETDTQDFSPSDGSDFDPDSASRFSDDSMNLDVKNHPDNKKFWKKSLLEREGSTLDTSQNNAYEKLDYAIDAVPSPMAIIKDMYDEMARLLFFAFLALLASPFLGVLYVLFLKSPPPLPDFDFQAWWGPRELQAKQDKSIKPFKVQFSQEMVQDLKERLKNHRKWTPPLENVAWQYGYNTNQLDSWVSYWAEKYNFQEREKFFNKFPQFKTNIQGLDIHFIRVKPEVPAGVDVVPMIILHGWGGSVREYYEALPLLTAVSKDRNFAIEAIVPSLPGFGFSDPAVRPGLGPSEIAIIMRNLMQRLGFKKFYLQGGDWGSIIGTCMVTIFPQEVLGYHTNMGFVLSTPYMILNLFGSVFPSFVVESHLAERMYPLGAKLSNLMEEFGYMHIQATKPDTIGVAMADSPAGLLAYILEKFSTVTKPEYILRPDGGLGEHWTKDQILDNLMVYWATNSFTTSVRIYSECFNKRYLGLQLDDIPTPVPTWVLQAKNEIAFISARILRFKFTNLVHTNPTDDGGHFFAFELPKVFTEDVLKAVATFRKLKIEAKKTEL